MSGDASCLSVVDLQSELLSELSSLDVDKVDVVSSGMNHSPESHRVCDLTVEPDVLISGEEPSQARPNNADDVAEHREEDQTTIEGQDETSAAGCPNRPFEGVKRSQPCISCLTPPAIGKETKVETIEEEVEGKPSSGEEFSVKPRFTHYVLTMR